MPPRPKPGRKPSIDTPASKRKAQNRAAQRAFRERRATRVQELEEKLLEVEKERDVKEMGLINTINKLKVENLFLMKTMDQFKAELHSLKKATGNGSNHSSPTNTSSSPANSVYSVQQISPAPSTSADSPPSFLNNPMSSRRSRTHNHSHPIRHYSEKRMSIGIPEEKVDPSFDCGVCLKDECLCESVGIKEKNSLEATLNKFKPMQAVSLRKRKSSTQEVDFTSKFVKKPLPDFKRLQNKEPKVKTETKDFNESSPVDNCGFCSDDTPCVCREAAKEAARLNESLNVNGNNEEMVHQMDQDSYGESDEDDETALPPLQMNSGAFRKSSLPVMHPGPSVDIRDITNLTPGAVPAVMTPNNKINDSPKKAGCTGNPGTCDQCQMDPMSTLFCTTVASKAKESHERSSSVSTRTSNERGSNEREPNERDVKPEDNNESTPGTVNSGPGNSNSDSDSTSPESSSDTKSSSKIPSRPGSLSLAPHSRSNSSANMLGDIRELPSMDTIKSQVSTPGAGPSTPTVSTPTSSDMFIPCSDAYKTLSRHKKFNSVDFSTLVGKLTTRGMQVEVQSVANVLRELDRRLYN